MACAAPAASPDAPSLPAPTYVPGDTWIYDRTHDVAKKSFTQERVVQTIQRVNSDSLLLGLKLDGSPSDFEDHLAALDLSERRIVNGQPTAGGRMLSFPMKVGSTWEEGYVDPHQQGLQTSAHVQKTYKVIRWEDVTVPAGRSTR